MPAGRPRRYTHVMAKRPPASSRRPGIGHTDWPRDWARLENSSETAPKGTAECAHIVDERERLARDEPPGAAAIRGGAGGGRGGRAARVGRDQRRRGRASPTLAGIIGGRRAWTI